MAKINTLKILSPMDVTNSVREWLNERNWEIKCKEDMGNYYIKARKSSWWRAGIGADRALQIHVYSNENGTTVEIGQGDWTVNILSNVAWAFATGGTNIAISGWSFFLQKQLKDYVQEMFDGANANPQIENQPSSDCRIEMQQTTIDEEEYHIEYHSLNNLNGEGSMKQEIILTQNWSNSFDIGYSKSDSFSMEQNSTSTKGIKHYMEQEKGLKEKIEQQVKSFYSIKGEQAQSYSQKTYYEVPAKRKLSIKIKWKRHWQNGIIRVFLSDNSKIEIPYKVIVGISHEPTTQTTDV